MRRTHSPYSIICGLLLLGTQVWAQAMDAGSIPLYNVATASRLSDDTEPAMKSAPPIDSMMPGMPGMGGMPANSPASYMQSAPPMGASPQNPYYGGGYSGGGAASTCGWAHHVAVFGEFQYLRARDSEVAYGVIANSVNGPVPGTPLTEVSRVGVVDFDYSPAFRGGIAFAFDCYNSITAQYSRYEDHTQNTIVGDGQNNRVATSLVFDPSTLSARSQTFGRGVANLGMNYDLIDIDYRNLTSCSDTHELTLMAGVRYGRLQQRFDTTFSENATGFAASQIDFEGFGGRLGLEMQKSFGQSNQVYVYGKGYLGLLAGEFDADYRNGTAFNNLQVDTHWTAGRLVTTTELELGMGWRSCRDTVRIQAGYVFNSWFNMMKTQEWIHAVQNSNYVDPASNFNGLMTFDGLTGRVEFRY